VRSDAAGTAGDDDLHVQLTAHPDVL